MKAAGSVPEPLPLLDPSDDGNGASTATPARARANRGGYRRPVDAPPHGQASCRGCGLTWTGIGEAHCTADGCHAHFTSTSAFDKHLRVGGCIPPKEVRNAKTGRQVLEPFKRDGITVWRNYVDPDKPLPASWRKR